jgi:hypothetical protein
LHDPGKRVKSGVGHGWFDGASLPLLAVVDALTAGKIALLFHFVPSVRSIHSEMD